jgi:hypothetical protein
MNTPSATRRDNPGVPNRVTPNRWVEFLPEDPASVPSTGSGRA